MMKLLFTMSCFLALGACTHTLKMPLMAHDDAAAKRLRDANPNAPKVKAEDCGRNIFIFPISIASDKQVFNKALQKAPGMNTLIDVNYSTNIFIIPIIYGQMCVEVEATAVKL